MIFFWPTVLMSLLMGLLNQVFPDSRDVWGGAFLVVFGLNLMVLTFEFPRGTSLTIAFVTVALVLGLILINQKMEIIKPLQQFLANREISASNEFYFFLFLIYLALFIGMYVVTRFDYWELTANELIHHHGLLGDVERFSTAGLKLNKEISDIFEYLLAGAGRIIMQIPGNPRPIILENVLAITRIEKMADRVLDARVVRLESPAGEPKVDDDRARLREGEEG
jgi:hypothetical protein